MTTTPAAARVPVRPDLAGTTPYGAPQLDVAVRLNTNETPWPPPASFMEALAQRIGGTALHRYPDRSAMALRTALGRRVGLPPDRVWVANGSNEVLQQLLQAYGGPGRRAQTIEPSYSMYPLLARATATELAPPVRLVEDFVLDAGGAARLGEHDPHLVVLATPNNPTGATLDLEAIRAAHDAHEGLLVLDEAYIDFGGRTAVGLLDALPRLVVCRTFSKAWRMAGLRLGYLYGPAWVVEDLQKVRLPYHLDTLTQTAGLLACEMVGEVTAHVTALAAERDRLHAALRRVPGVRVWPSDGNFLLFRPERPGVFGALLARGVLVRDFSTAPGLDGCLRVTVGTPQEDDVFLHALSEVMAS